MALSEDFLNRFRFLGGVDHTNRHHVQQSVTNSLEFQRIRDLPRRDIDQTLADDVTAYFRRPGGTMSLRPLQAAALVEAAEQNGLFAPLGVGAGKSLICLLLPAVLDSERAVLLVPATLKPQVKREIETIYRHHFELPLSRITLLSYHDISQAKNAHILEQLDPDLIVADEAHNLRHKSAARTKRFIDFIRQKPACRFCALSGTMTSRSIMDFAHLVEIALRKNSPLPRGYHELREWAGALDVKPEQPYSPGVLLQFCDGNEDVRVGYRRRMVQTGGVIASDLSAFGASLVIRRLDVEIPTRVKGLLGEVRDAWSLEGEEFDSILTRARVLRQIAMGFYYRWAWPGGVVDHEWLIARGEWNKAVREKLHRATTGMDSPLLLSRAAERWNKGERDSKAWDCPAWAPWKAVKDRDPPPTETVWLDDFLVKAAVERAEGSKRSSILWYEHRAVGERLSQITDYEIYGEGTDASAAVDEIICCSIGTQLEGKNLQHYSNNVVTSWPSSGKTVEQLIGRTHRPGQEADEVYVDWFGHTDELLGAMASAQADATYQQDLTGQPQKLLIAQHVS